MRCLKRNKSCFYYALYVGKRENILSYDTPTELPFELNSVSIGENGYMTGEYQPIYGKPELCKANISAAKGEIQTRQFGEQENYDKVIVLDDIDTPINEYSILWVDKKPLLAQDGTLVLNDNEIVTPHDYIVKKIAKSLNSVSIAISKVNVQ